MAPLGKTCDRLWVGDAPGAIREGAVVGESGEEIILMNDLREFSFSLYGGTVTSGGVFSANSAVLDRAVGVLRDHTARMVNLDEDVNYDYGIAILHDKRTDKRLGSLRLMRKLGLSSFVMVGNSMTDYVGEDIARHYAVANATKEFRAVVHGVAKTPLAEGCTEIMDMLCNENGA